MDLVLVLGLEGLVLVLGCLILVLVLVGLVLVLVLGLECLVLVLVLVLEDQVLVNITGFKKDVERDRAEKKINRKASIAYFMGRKLKT